MEIARNCKGPHWRTGSVRAIGLSLLVACQPLAADAAGGVPEITLRLVNSARVPEAKLLQGEKEAAYILGKAGVGVAWRDCYQRSDGPCGSTLGAADFWMHVATWKPATASVDMLGFTQLNRDAGEDDRAALVYYPAVSKQAESLEVDESDLLGAALAHEIGHLLGVGHSQAGVMCPRFTREQMLLAREGRLLFTAPQAAKMRAEISGASRRHNPPRNFNATRRPNF